MSGGDDGAGGRDAGTFLVIGGELEEHVPLGLVLDGPGRVGDEGSGEGEVDGVALAQGMDVGGPVGVDPGCLEDEGAGGAGDLASRSYGGEAQGLGHEALAPSGGSHQQYVLVLVQELQGEDGVQEPAVEGDVGRPVEVLQAAGLLEAGALKPQFNAPVGAAIDLVAEDDPRKEA